MRAIRPGRGIAAALILLTTLAGCGGGDTPPAYEQLISGVSVVHPIAVVVNQTQQAKILGI